MAVVLYPHTESLAVMSRGGGAPIDLVLGLVVGNVAYLLFTIILAMTLGVAPTDVFSGPFSGAANSLVSAWMAVGGLLGVVDVLAVLGFISSVLRGGR
jgi:hypothetical protein